MHLFIDTNILLDVAMARLPHGPPSREILAECEQRAIATTITWHSVTNVFYVLGRAANRAQARAFLKDCLGWMNVAPTSKQLLQRGMSLDGDLEDHLQWLCAEAVNADYIVTRDTKGFASSPIPAVCPEVALNHLRGS